MTVFETLSADDAYVYLQVKDKLPSGLLINVIGKVTAVSEIFRVKKDLLFLIEIENIVKIIVKQKHYQIWQGRITPELEYVITNLRATTLQKGSLTPSKLFIPWSKSSLHLTSDIQYTVISLKDWFCCNKIEIPETIQTEISNQHGQVMDERPAKFVSYQGVITNCDQAHVGIYELDHRIGLYVGGVPACHKFSSLTLSSKIVVYNAHRRGFANIKYFFFLEPELAFVLSFHIMIFPRLLFVPKIRLFGCVSTCIRVVETGQQVSIKQQSLTSILLQPISVYSLTSSEIACLMDLPTVLAQKLNITTCSFSSFSLIQLIPLLLSTSCCPWLQEDPRNLVHEFLHVPHSCCVAMSKKTSRIPAIVQISKERDDLKDKSHDLTDLQQKYYGSRLSLSELNQQLYWSLVSDTVEGNTGKILLGYLQCNPVTGRLQLQDSTGSMDVVICSFSPIVSHVCSPQCLNPRPGSLLICPMMQPSLLGSIICVRKYRRIVERFLSTDVPNSYHIDSKYISRSRYITYFMLSLTDCVLLYVSRHSWQSQSSVQCENKTNEDSGNVRSQMDMCTAAPPKKSRTDDDPAVREVTQFVYVSHKESLMSASRNVSPHLRFCVLGNLIKQSGTSVEIDVTSCKSKNVNSFCCGLTSKDTCKNEKENCDRASESRDTHQCAGRHSASCQISGADTPTEPVVLLFQDNIQWFPVIHADAFYRLTVKGDVDLLQPQLHGEKLQKAAKSSHTRMCLQVPSCTVVTRVLSQEDARLQKLDPSVFNKPDQVDIAEILSDSCSASQVNFSGRIVSRCHKTQDNPSVGRNKNSKANSHVQLANEQLGVSVLDNTCVCLQVQSLTSQREIQVYMNLQNTSYPLGLLPGVGVQLSRLERKVSRIDKVYCQYTAVSTVEVFQVLGDQIQRHPIPSSTAAGSSSIEIKTDHSPSPAHQYIVDVWRSPTAAQLFSSDVYICHVMKLCLKSVCCGCGSMVTSVGCSSPACHITSSSLSARVSILVDDGTCPAVVTFANCHEHIQKLLRLSTEQWRHLEIATQDQGEVFLQQFVGEGDSILESFLIRLCNSKHVKRQCRMSLQHRDTHSTGCNTWKAGVIDVNKMAKDEFSYHSVKASSMFETRCVPYLQLECVDLQETNNSWV